MKAQQAIKLSVEMGVQVNMKTLAYRHVKINHRHQDTQTEIKIGNNLLKSAAMSLLGKRCFVQTMRGDNPIQILD